MDCGELADTGIGIAGWCLLAVVVLSLGVAVALVGRRHRATTSALVLALAIGGASVIGLTPVPAAQASQICPAPTTNPTNAPTPNPTPTSGTVVAIPIGLDDWAPASPCAAGAASCTFTVDVATLGDSTTSPGASIDYTTFAPTSAPPGYVLTFDPSTFVLTAVVTTATPPDAVPTYTVKDTAGAVSNPAEINLPVIPAAGGVVSAPNVAPRGDGTPVIWLTATCNGETPCTTTADFDDQVTTTNPDATIDWNSLDLDLTTPGIQQTVTPIPSYLIAFDPTTHTLTAFSDTCTVSNPVVRYTVADSFGTVSNPANIFPFTDCA